MKHQESLNQVREISAQEREATIRGRLISHFLSYLCIRGIFLWESFSSSLYWHCTLLMNLYWRSSAEFSSPGGFPQIKCYVSCLLLFLTRSYMLNALWKCFMVVFTHRNMIITVGKQLFVQNYQKMNRFMNTISLWLGETLQTCI